MHIIKCHYCHLNCAILLYLIVFYCLFNILYFLGRGGWNFKPGQPQKNKTNMNILRQEKLIAEKKKEIEARMAEQAKMSAQTTSKPLPPR